MVEMRAVLLLGLSLLWPAASHAAEPPGPALQEERSKQERIYRGDGQERVEGYTIDRSLDVYADGLHTEFARDLAQLGPADRWLDIGAGQGQAILDYYTIAYDRAHAEGQQHRGTKAQAVAMSIEDRRTPLWQRTAARLGGNQIRYVADRRLREYSLEELGQFQIITDVIGGFSYSENLSLFMEKVLGFLAMNGSFYTVLQDIHREDGTNTPFYQGASFLTEIRHPDGAELKVCAWLKRIGCAEVTCQPRAQWQPPLEAFRVRKVCEAVSVPPLTLLDYKAGTPPERKFELKEH